MSQAGAFPLHADAVAATADHLAANMAAHVDNVVPNPRPPRLVTVRRTGGPAASRVSDRPQVTVECWAPTAKQAQDDAQLARQLIHQMADGSPRGDVIVYRVDEFAGPVDLPDPVTPYPRYTFTVSMHTRPAAGS